MSSGLYQAFMYLLAAAVGLTLALSSTAIVLQSLGERGLMKTPAGEATFAVLLFQDVAVIAILALLPLLTIDTGLASAAPGGVIARSERRRPSRTRNGGTTARRVAEIFREHDEASVREMAKLLDDDADYVSIARKHIENLERSLQSDVELRPDATAESGVSPVA
jgi:hypothetical protein